MNIKQAYKYLKNKYPELDIIERKDGEKVEKLIVDVEPTQDHPDWSRVVSFIFDSEPHCHRETKETYTVIMGVLELSVDGKTHVLKKGESFVILPGQVHFGKGSNKGDGVLIECYMEPGWREEDHFVV